MLNLLYTHQKYSWILCFNVTFAYAFLHLCKTILKFQNVGPFFAQMTLSDWSHLQICSRNLLIMVLTLNYVYLAIFTHLLCFRVQFSIFYSSPELIFIVFDDIIKIWPSWTCLQYTKTTPKFLFILNDPLSHFKSQILSTPSCKRVYMVGSGLL